MHVGLEQLGGALFVHVDLKLLPEHLLAQLGGFGISRGILIQGMLIDGLT